MDRVLIGDVSEVLIGRGAPAPLLPPREGRQRVAVLYQGTVGPLAAGVADGCAGDVEVHLREVPDRESVKDLTEVAHIYRWLAETNLGRHDTVVAVGGGAVTDAAGFVGATWLRGVEVVMVPTTLLAAVDAAIGGKTGVNVPVGSGYAKNLVGSFWHPSRVIVDLDTLDRLPAGLRAEGTAEVLKAGLIDDPEIVSAYQRDGAEAPLDEVVPRAVRVKARVVEADFREQGQRAVLNLGHTLGHAVEGLTGFPHGHAVAVGMVGESVIAGARFGADHRWLAELIFSLGLPVAAAGISRDAARELILRDKKRDAGGVRMALLRGVGQPEVVTVTDEEIDLGLSAIGAG